MNESSYPILESVEKHVQAARLRICAPETALKHVSSDYMRQWYQWQPGVLFRYGMLSLSEEPEIYFGGLTVQKQVFVLVPQELYEQRRRSLLFQLVRERLATNDVAVLLSYCELAEREIVEDFSPRDHPALDAEARARQVSYWIRLLAYRQELPMPEWRWQL